MKHQIYLMHVVEEEDVFPQTLLPTLTEIEEDDPDKVFYSSAHTESGFLHVFQMLSCLTCSATSTLCPPWELVLPTDI